MQGSSKLLSKKKTILRGFSRIQTDHVLRRPKLNASDCLRSPLSNMHVVCASFAIWIALYKKFSRSPRPSFEERRRHALLIQQGSRHGVCSHIRSFWPHPKVPLLHRPSSPWELSDRNVFQTLSLGGGIATCSDKVLGHQSVFWFRYLRISKVDENRCLDSRISYFDLAWRRSMYLCIRPAVCLIGQDWPYEPLKSWPELLLIALECR